MKKFIKTEFIFNYMNKEIVEEIIDKINEKIKSKEFPISKENFKKIEILDSDKKIAFIDGGQAELIKAVDFSLQFIRIAGLVFEGKKKVDRKINEFFILINAIEENENIKFVTEMFTVKGEVIKDISINSLENSIKKGNERGRRHPVRPACGDTFEKIGGGGAKISNKKRGKY